jgi:hypothetical protein
LFYADLGGIPNSSILGSGDADLEKFTNIQNYAYWSNLVYYVNLGFGTFPDAAWIFYMHVGYQDPEYKYNELSAWAVRSGDVVAVPEADTWAMLLAGLGLVGVAAKRRRG